MLTPSGSKLAPSSRVGVRARALAPSTRNEIFISSVSFARGKSGLMAED